MLVDNKIVAIKSYQFKLLMEDDRLITEKDRMKNKMMKGDIPRHPTLSERVEKIINIFYGLETIGIKDCCKKYEKNI